MANEYEDIFSWHPQLVLVSRKPVSWRGFLKINNNMHIEIKLKVPEYPQMKNASIHFSRKIHLMNGTDFASKVKALLHNAPSVLSFLNQLKKIMANILKENPNYCNTNIHRFNTKTLEELKDTLAVPGIVVSVDKDLTIIKLSNKNVSMQVKQDPTGNDSWMIVSSDLPQLKGWESLEKCVSTLTEAANILKTRVAALEDTWKNLKTIDENCWIIDPIDPKPYHLYRRIYLNVALSILITLNPLDPESLHAIKILGSDNEVLKCENIVNENLYKWSYDRPILDNLLDLLNISELPRPPNKKENESVINDGIVSDDECCICFSSDLDNGEIPSEICNNEKCRRIFHASCLSQWLAAVVGNQIVFERVHGNCPNCNESISCRIVSK